MVSAQIIASYKEHMEDIKVNVSSNSIKKSKGLFTVES